MPVFQQTFTCFKSTINAFEKVVNKFKVNNKDTSTRSFTSLFFLLLVLNVFLTFFKCFYC